VVRRPVQGLGADTLSGRRRDPGLTGASGLDIGFPAK